MSERRGFTFSEPPRQLPAMRITAPISLKAAGPPIIRRKFMLKRDTANVFGSIMSAWYSDRDYAKIVEGFKSRGLSFIEVK